MGYIERSALKDTLGLSDESYADNDLDLAIASASEAVDSATGRTFTRGLAVATRIFVPPRYNWVEINDLASFGATGTVDADVTGGGTFTALDAADFQLYPLNAEADGQPWTELKLRDTATCWEPPCTQVRVTGVWGWPDIPPGVVEATGLIAARLLKRAREAPFGIAGFGGDGTAVRVTSNDPDVRMLLNPYSRQVRLA
jgi:hypothetical protein